MLQVRVILTLLLLFLLISALPIVQIKYASDLYDSVEKMSDACYQNFKCSNENIALPEKYKYIYNIANVLYDIDDLDNNDIDDSGDEDEKKTKYKKFYKNLFIAAFVIIILIFTIYITIYRNNKIALLCTTVLAIITILLLGLSIFYFQTKNVNLKEHSMLLYRKYLNYSMPTFFLGIWKFLFIYIYLFIQYYDNSYISISLMISIFIITVFFTIIFGLILKKITEIYNDTILKEYIDLMKKINIIFNQNIIKDNEDVEIINLKKMSEKIKEYTNDKDRYFKEIAFSQETLQNLVNKYKIGNEIIEITEDDIINYEKYHSKKRIDEVKFKIDTVTSYLYAYAFIILIIIYFYMRTIDDNSVYVFIIFTYITIVIMYYMYVSLR